MKFIKLDSYNTDDINFNLIQDPDPIYKHANCFTETDAAGNTIITAYMIGIISREYVEENVQLSVG